MAEVGEPVQTPARQGLVRKLGHNLLLAITKLPEPYNGMYERLYVQGAKDGDVAKELRITPPEFQQRKTELLRMLHRASTT